MNDVLIVKADARHLPLKDTAVDCCVTSPPYWGLRDYGTDGQLGLERSPDEYVANMVQVFREVRRVLKDAGTLWLNLGDSYASNAATKENPAKVSGCFESHRGSDTPTLNTNKQGRIAYRGNGIKAKDLIGIPWRVAFALQADGWWLRSDIIWAKPNPMPESVTDRPTKAHEYIFLMAKSERYAYDAEAIGEPLISSEDVYLRAGKSVRENHAYGEVAGRPLGDGSFATMPAFRNSRTVWTIATQPYSGAHFATFPEELARRCIRAGCPAGGTVLDPFAGSGTVGKVAIEEGRSAILCDLAYHDLQKARTAELQRPLI